MLKKLVVLATIAIAALFAAGTAWADGVPITNSSFETSNPLNISCGYFECSYTYGIPGWNVTNGGTWHPGPVVFPSIPGGGDMAAFTNHGSIWQTLAATVQANTVYTLQVFVGNRADGINGTYTLSLDTILNGVLTTLCSTPVLDAHNIAAHTFQSEGCTYSSSGSNLPEGNLFLIFSSNYGQLDVTDVSLTSVDPPSSVPEPSSVFLLGFGLLLAVGTGLWGKQKVAPLSV